LRPVRSAGPTSLPPDAALEARGLTRSGTLYVLADAESTALAKLAEVEPYFARVQESRGIIQVFAGHDATVLDARNRRSALNARIAQLDDMIRRFGRKNTLDKQLLKAERARLFDERAALLPQLAAAERTQAPLCERKRVFADFEKRRAAFLDKARYVRLSAERAQNHYEDLARDRTVTDALKALQKSTKARIALGPSSKFKSAYRAFRIAATGAKSADELFEDYLNERQMSAGARAKGTKASARR
jgi:hypothetical protein